MTTEATIKDAIARSISHTEIVRVIFSGGAIAPSVVGAAPPDYPAEEAQASNEPWPQD